MVTIDTGQRKLLIISYHFPPMQSIASLRLRGLAKYLPEFGWYPVILTPRLPGRARGRYDVVETPYPGDVTDVWKRRLGLNQENGREDESIDFHPGASANSPLWRNLRRLGLSLVAFPDQQKYWRPHAVREGVRILKNRSFSAMLSSSGPATSHLIATKLKETFGLPWIADFRDLWSQNHYRSLGPVTSMRTRWLELRTLKNADATTTVSRPLAERLQSLHKHVPAHVITNGYDPEEVVGRPLTRRLTITYAGSLYQGKRNPAPLFSSLHRLFKEGKIKREDVQVRFYGAAEGWLKRLVQQYGLSDVVDLHSVVPRAEVLERQRESHLLLLLNWDHPREKGVYTGKIFEYLAARRPILALGGPGGVVAELLRDTGVGVHAGTEEDLRRVLLKWYGEYCEQGFVAYKGRAEIVSRYSQRTMAMHFSTLFNELIRLRAEK